MTLGARALPIQWWHSVHHNVSIGLLRKHLYVCCLVSNTHKDLNHTYNMHRPQVRNVIRKEFISTQLDTEACDCWLAEPNPEIAFRSDHLIQTTWYRPPDTRRRWCDGKNKAIQSLVLLSLASQSQINWEIKFIKILPNTINHKNGIII